MCNRYHPSRRETYWEEFRAMPPENLPVGPIFPRKAGPFVRADADGARQVVAGQWGLIPWFFRAPILMGELVVRRNASPQFGPAGSCAELSCSSARTFSRGPTCADFQLP